MFVAAQNTQAQSLILQGGNNWNLFLFGGTPPTDMQTFPFQLATMESIYANSIVALRANAVNSAGYGQELLAFEHVAMLYTLKMHGARSNNGVTGILCMPQSISSNIEGLDEPAGYVNGLNEGTVAAQSTTNEVTNKWIQFNLGVGCSITKVLFGNMSITTRNASNAIIEYYDANTSQWAAASAPTGVKTYSATGIEFDFAPVEAQLWRIRFLDNTGTIPSNVLQYRFLRFIASTQPIDALDKSTTDITWAIAVPANPNTTTYKAADATQVPALILTAGGPVDGGVVVLNRRRVNISDYLTLVHLKIFGGVVQEIEDIT